MTTFLILKCIFKTSTFTLRLKAMICVKMSFKIAFYNILTKKVWFLLKMVMTQWFVWGDIWKWLIGHCPFKNCDLYKFLKHLLIKLTLILTQLVALTFRKSPVAMSWPTTFCFKNLKNIHIFIFFCFYFLRI